MYLTIVNEKIRFHKEQIFPVIITIFTLYDFRRKRLDVQKESIFMFKSQMSAADTKVLCLLSAIII